MKYLIIFLFILVGCNGEVEKLYTEPVKPEKTEQVKPVIEIKKEVPEPEKPADEIRLDSGFREVGHYEDPIGCPWTIYKKEYQVTWLYIHVDCKGNRIKIHREK